MDIVDEARRESFLDARISRRPSASAPHLFAGRAVIPTGNSQTDIATLLLQFPLPDLDVDNVTVRLMQDELASIRR